jgi:hypothetical protein
MFLYDFFLVCQRIENLRREKFHKVINFLNIRVSKLPIIGKPKIKTEEVGVIMIP